VARAWHIGGTHLGVRVGEGDPRPQAPPEMRTTRPLLSRNHAPPGSTSPTSPPRWSRLGRPRGERGPSPYDAKPDRPLAQQLVRAGLWVALVVGCVGGLVALVRPGGDDRPPVTTAPSGGDVVPAPVAGVAELTVERWLAASDAERRELDELFAEPVAGADGAAGRDGSGGLPVTQVTTVAGERLEEGYWSVTVAAELVGLDPTTTSSSSDGDPGTATSPPAEGNDGDPGTSASPPALEDDSDDAATTTTWFVEIGIVARGDGYLALTTPAVLPAPPTGDPDWTVSGDRAAPEPDDELADLVGRFLSALLAGSGDPAPYLAPGTEVTAADPPPFAEVEVAELAVEDLGAGQLWVSVHVLATTADGGATLPATYDLVLVERADRWEVVELAGVPTLIE
jgi:hypothetical protein